MIDKHKIVWGSARHRQKIIDLEETVYGQWAYTKETYNKFLKDPHKSILVYQQLDEILGYLIYDIGVDDYTILRITTDPLYTQEKIASRLMEKVKALTKTPRDKIKTLIPEDNLVMHLFLKNQKFKATKVVPKAFYTDTDGYQFEYVSPNPSI